jgi:Fe-S cluster biogenesis protein NfuA
MRQVNIHIEGVPNPHAIKFVLENGVLTQDNFEFRSFAETGFSPLARKLMMLKYITRVHLHKNYITLVKNEKSIKDWDEVLPEIREIIVSHLSKNEPILYLGFHPQTHNTTGMDEFHMMLVKILDTHIRPAAQEDGGDILIESYKDGKLKLNLVGSCKGCPYISQTVNQGIQTVLRNYFPEVLEVTW